MIELSPEAQERQAELCRLIDDVDHQHTTTVHYWDIYERRLVSVRISAHRVEARREDGTPLWDNGYAVTTREAWDRLVEQRFFLLIDPRDLHEVMVARHLTSV